MRCPVCAREHPSMLCPRCGFDSSRDYEKYPTFCAVGVAPAASTLRKEWAEQQQPAVPEPSIVSANSAQPAPAPEAPPSAAPVPKNKWIALLLCFFLGMFGAHKFYEGNKKMGIIYLCTYGLFGYGWLFDWITLLFRPNPYIPRFRQRRLKQ